MPVDRQNYVDQAFRPAEAQFTLIGQTPARGIATPPRVPSRYFSSHLPCTHLLPRFGACIASPRPQIPHLTYRAALALPMASPHATETTRLLHSPTEAARSPTTAHDDSEPTKSPTRSTPLNFRIAATMFSFMVTGLFNASIGVLLPPISHHYNLTDLHVSFIFLCGPIGYVLASPSNASIHALLGQRGIAVIGPLLHTLAALGIAAHPPFPIVLVAFVVNAMGIGLVDGSWCAWAGGLERANVVSGLLHGSYSAGAAVGPFATGLWIAKTTRPWWEWYYVVVRWPWD